MPALTKLALQQINTRLAEENAALRARLSLLETQQQADAPSTQGITVREHAYETFAEAREACQRLTRECGSDKYTFVQQGLRVICRPRVSRPH